MVMTHSGIPGFPGRRRMDDGVRKARDLRGSPQRSAAPIVSYSVRERAAWSPRMGVLTLARPYHRAPTARLGGTFGGPPLVVPLPAVEKSHQRCGGNQAESVIDDLSDLLPIRSCVPRPIEEHPQPVRERPSSRRCRLEEPFGISTDQLPGRPVVPGTTAIPCRRCGGRGSNSWASSARRSKWRRGSSAHEPPGATAQSRALVQGHPHPRGQAWHMISATQSGLIAGRI